MSRFYDRAVELRACSEPKYNCAQAVVCSFAEEAGFTREQLYRATSTFGGGMKRGAVCGAISGGLMVLGMFCGDDTPVVSEYHRRLREVHNGALDCAELLRINHEKGGDKKEHCDGMVFECVNLVEELLKERGKLS